MFPLLRLYPECHPGAEWGQPMVTYTYKQVAKVLRRD